MSNIRVTYSGLISFAVGISSVMTGIIFTIIVTRTLTPEEFGTWNLVGALISYVTIIEPMISYWTTREIARGIESGKTAIFSSGIFSIVGISIYILIGYLFATPLHANQSILLFASILVPVMFFNRTLTAVNLGWKPQATSYGILCFEITKIPVALVFVYFLHHGIYGAIFSTFMAYLASNIILAIYARKKIRDKIKIEFLKKWIKLSWVTLYPGIYTIVFHLDVVIFSVITGSVIGLAFYSAALTIANLVTNSALISRALYPKLLEGGSEHHLKENLLRFTYFAFPLASIVIIFAKPALFALKPIYEVAVPAVIFLTVRAFLDSLGGIYSQSLLGIEKVDINEKSTIKDFIKSKLFFIPTLTLLQYGIYIISLTVGLILLKPIVTQNVDFIVFWSVILAVMQAPFTVIYYLLARKHFIIRTDFRIVFKYLISSIVIFGITYLLMDKFLIYKKNIFEFIPNLLIFALPAMGGYLLITYLLDSRTRTLFQSVIKEFKQ